MKNAAQKNIAIESASDTQSEARERAMQAVERAQERNRLKQEKRLKDREADAVLVTAAKAGDAQAFRTLVEQNQGRLFAVAFGMLRDRDDAMDAVQDALIKAHRKLLDFEGNAAFSTWIYRICVNLCIDKKRSQARRRSVDLDEARSHELSDDTLYADAEITPKISGTNPLKNIANSQLGAQIGLALATLSDEHRAVLLLREVEGMNYEEISDALDVPKGTVMSRLFHARKNMQIQLRPLLETNDPLLGEVRR
ncbi:MAG: sigma-70 family RNA polymerase sigma factor [Deltaproteobacteria bacterium]|nr:sigma-70 family RNA polymerase sigma factor [Deltaproteobacteria bacterium]